MTTLAADRNEELAQPRPLAWAYMLIPSSYDHAAEQWRQQLIELAAREGYSIGRIFVDASTRRDSLESMLQAMGDSKCQAVFVPSISQLDDGLDVGMPQTLRWTDTRQRLSEALGMPIFVLSDGFAPITTPHQLEQQWAPHLRPRRGRRWLRQRHP